MGEPVSTALLVSAAIGTGAKLKQGYDQKKESQKQADAIKKDSEDRSEEMDRRAKLLRSSQAQSFLSSGVSLEGSPLLVLQETEKLAKKDILNESESASMKAASLRRQGRNALLGGVLEGLSTAGSTSSKVMQLKSAKGEV